MKVGVVYQHLPHYRYGVFKQLERIADWDVTYLADVKSRDGSIRVIEPTLLKSVKRLRNHWLGPVLFQSGLHKQIIKEGYDIVIFLGDWSYLSTWTAAGVCRLRRSRVYFWTIGWHRPEQGLRRLLRLLFYRLADGLLLYGKTAKSIGADLGYPQTRMHVVGNSDGSSLMTLTSEEPTGEFASRLPEPGRPAIGGVIRLTTAKRLDLVIQAAAQVRALGIDVAVLFVGNGSECQHLRDLADTLDVPLYLPGAAYSEELLELAYSSLWLSVIPALAGLTVLQSMRHGVPVITNGDPYQRSPESDAIIPGVTGAFFAAGDVHNLGRVLAQWLASSDIERKKIAEDCRAEIADNWTAERQAARIREAVDG